MIETLNPDLQRDQERYARWGILRIKLEDNLLEACLDSQTPLIMLESLTRDTRILDVMLSRVPRMMQPYGMHEVARATINLRMIQGLIHHSIDNNGK